MRALEKDVDDIFTRALATVDASKLVDVSDIGRPLFDGKDVKEVVSKLSLAAAIGASVKESCFFADISTDSYYRCLNKNPEFRNHLDQLRHIPILQARITIMRQLMAGDVKLCKWYLEHKCPSEFSVTGGADFELKALERRIAYLEVVLQKNNIKYYLI